LRWLLALHLPVLDVVARDHERDAIRPAFFPTIFRVTAEPNATIAARIDDG
jgi:hypothetical protein